MRSPALRRLATLTLVFGLVAACGPVAVEVAGKGTASATKKKSSSKPKGSPSPAGTAKPGASATPTASPVATKSPSAAPTASATAAASATASPTASPSAAATATAGPTGDWSGTMTPDEARAFAGFPFSPVGRSWIYETAIQGPLPLTAEMTWTVKTVTDAEATIDTEISVLGQSQKDTQAFPRALPTPGADAPPITKERLVVPAGTYDTVKVTAKQADGSTAEQWFAKDVGIVQLKTKVQGQAATLKLKAFKAS
jgi:hypothetical protein